MKLVRMQGVSGVGAVEGGEVIELEETMSALIAGVTPTPTGRRFELDSTRLDAPVAEDCRGLFCTGINYRAHQEESADTFSPTVPEHPIFFFKHLSSLAGPYDELLLDAAVSTEFDWEVELGVVIGRTARNVGPEDAFRYIFGYTIVNDVTARDLQKRHQQWHLGKNVDRSTPVGPWIVTADEISFPPLMDLTLRVNGVVKQHATTRDFLFDISRQIATLSASMTLLPGDVVSTGTPAGVGFTRNPPEFLCHGDLMETEVRGLGVLRNRIATSAALTTSGPHLDLDEAVAIQPVGAGGMR